MRCIDCGKPTYGTEFGGTRLAVCPTCAGRDEAAAEASRRRADRHQSGAPAIALPHSAQPSRTPRRS